jgi:protein BCP1
MDHDHLTDSGSELSTNDAMDTDQDDDSASDGLVHVDFEFFDPRESDFTSIRLFLRQFFGPDHTLHALSDMANAIVEQKLLGTTIKTEDSEADPFAILTVLNLTRHTRHKDTWVTTLLGYWMNKAGEGYADARNVLNKCLEAKSEVGWVFSERLLNMPVQTVPPMYTMLLEEIEWALEDGEEYRFEWLVVVCKTYKEVASTADEDMKDAPLKTSAKKKQKGDVALFYAQSEEEVMSQFATHQFDFDFTEQDTVSDAKRAFQEQGIHHARRLMLIHKDKIKAMIKAIGKFCGE